MLYLNIQPYRNRKKKKKLFSGLCVQNIGIQLCLKYPIDKNRI